MKARQHHVGQSLTCRQYSHLTLAGKPTGLFSLLDEYLLAPVWLLRQLPEDKLVAAVATLRTLPLLYRVNADVDVPALDIELRQLFDDAMELALEASGRPLRVLVGETPRLLTGETARWERWSTPCGPRCSKLLFDVNMELEDGPQVLALLAYWPYGWVFFGRRPRLFQLPMSSGSGFKEDGAGGALRLMRRLVTLLAVEDIGLLGADACSTLPLLTSAGVSSTGGTLTPALLALPKESFHFEGFFEIADDDDEEEAGTEVVDAIADDEKGKGAPRTLGTMAGGAKSGAARPLDVDTACD